ncbi:MMPL family transporter [Aestuariibacter sp. AA17]|uniref:MMPL family transporter n=1 Tax=Fluctibacter corallii TaxID=2984329 RepID=A0ABT3A7E4_9ALTE|nr:MMPL family transporter [Aestuariibacter sp. AA17]MCV2884197.1 MMPL family transporter [Aestuariibacter sp. AA17]
MSKSRIANALVNQAQWLLILFLLLAAIAAYGLQFFKIDASADTLLVKNNRLYIQTQMMNKRFAPQEFILVAVEPKNAPLFSQQTFSLLQAMAEEINELPRVDSVTHMLNVPLLSQIDSLQGEIDPDDWTWEAKQYDPKTMQDIFSDHPLFTDLLVNKAQSATAIQIVFKHNQALQALYHQITDIQAQALEGALSDKQEADIQELKAQAEPIEAELTKQRKQEIEALYKIIASYDDQADLYLGGSYVLGQQLIDIIESDLVTFGSAIGLAICVLLLLFFKSIRWVMLPVICCGFSVLYTMGLFGFLDLRTTVISANFVALQLILTLAIVIHLIVEFRQCANQSNEEDIKPLLVATLQRKLAPCFYAGLTTSVGFGSLIFSGIQPVVTFGWMMIIATIISIVTSLVLFPAILTLFSHKDMRSDGGLSRGFISLTRKISMNAPNTVVLTTVVITVFSVVGLLRLDVENSFLDYFADSTNVHKELTFIDSQFGGSTPMDVVVTLPDEFQKQDVTLSAKSIQTLQKIQYVLSQYEATGNITSIVNFTELAKQINQGQPLTEYELTVIYTLLDKSLRDKLLGSYFSPEHNQLRISSRIQDSTEGLDRQQFMDTLSADMKQMGLPEENVTITNLFVLYQDILQRLFTSQIMTLGIVYIALFVVLLFIFKQLSIATIALLPNILTTLVVLGVMGWLNIPLDLMTITIAAIAMGIAIDDTIHFVHRYLESNDAIVTGARQRQSTALDNTFSSVGYALFYTTSVITLGFSLLSFSDFVPSILFGLLTGFAMVFALIVDTTLLPVLLERFVGRKALKSQAHDV